MSGLTNKAGLLRPLLPAHDRKPSLTSKVTPASRINAVVSACEECRRRKTRPGESHSHAFRKSYYNLQSRARAHEELFEILKSLPTKESLEVLERIRSGTDVDTILSHLKAGDVLLQMAVTPESRFRYDFPFKTKMPNEIIHDNPYLDSIIFEATSLYAKDLPSVSSEIISTGFARNLQAHEYQKLYLKPFHAAEVVEPQLSNVKPSYWTKVSEDDILMRDILGSFFRCEYQFTAVFNKDLFLEDMAAQRHDFCSPLLTNVVLAYACVCYPRFSNRAEYWNPNTLLYRFLAEARRIWELEASGARITTIQAGIIFNVIYNLCGLDEVGQTYRVHAIRLAHTMRLFDNCIDIQDQKVRNARIFTAWALFNWETLVGFSFLFPPLLRVPPDCQLPDPSEDAQFYGEIWVRYPQSNSLLPSSFGHLFRARSRFRIIMNQFCQKCFSEGSQITPDDADGFRHELRRWYDDLPPILDAKSIVLPGHLQLHMYYHHLILTIYEPLIEMNTTLAQSPQKIVTDARRYLQTLVRLYYLRHGFEAMDLFIVIPLMVIGYESIDAIANLSPGHQAEALQSTLILAAKGLHVQRQNHFLAEALFRVIRGRMRPEEQALLKHFMRINEGEEMERQSMVLAVRSRWPVSVVKKKEEVDSHILTNLVESYGRSGVVEELAPAGT